MKIKDVSIRDLRSISNLEHQIFKENAFSIKLVEKLIQQNTLFLKLEDGKIMKKLIGFIVVIKDREDQANIIS